MAGEAQPYPAESDTSWSSAGLRRRDAIRLWQDWAARTIAPIDVCVIEEDHFAARWRSQAVGQLRMLELTAPAQRVVHRGSDAGSGRAAPAIQLVYSRRGAMRTRVGGDTFLVEPGEFVLLDNTRFYQMEMDTEHEVIDLMMPRGWLERWMPDPDHLLARAISARSGWGSPLGSLLETMSRGIDDSPLPRPMIAEQVGALLAFATGRNDDMASHRHGTLVQRVLTHIERDYADPELDADHISATLGISKRYMQSLLAARGTSFVQELTATRLERAGAVLADPRARGLHIGEVAFQCGFLDPGYFARQFRKRFGVAPRQWRLGRTAS
jgi:AraC-like DNA-binding protein